MKQFLIGLTRKLLRQDLQIPYLSLPAYEDPITIPYIELSPAGAISRRETITYDPAETGIIDRLYTLYDEVIYLLTQAQSRLFFAGTLSLISIYYSFQKNIIVAYGDQQYHPWFFPARRYLVTTSSSYDVAVCLFRLPLENRAGRRNRLRHIIYHYFVFPL